MLDTVEQNTYQNNVPCFILLLLSIIQIYWIKH